MKKNGPPPKPTELKVLLGTFRADRVAPDSPKPPSEIPDMPEFLSVEAAAEWRLMSQRLYDLGLLAFIHRAALTAYCEAWSDFVEASRLCATQDGVDRKTLKAGNGVLTENPYFRIKRESMTLMHKFLTEFGMTPAAGTRVNAKPPGDKPKSAWEKFGAK